MDKSKNKYIFYTNDEDHNLEPDCSLNRKRRKEALRNKRMKQSSNVIKDDRRVKSNIAFITNDEDLNLHPDSSLNHKRRKEGLREKRMKTSLDVNTTDNSVNGIILSDVTNVIHNTSTTASTSVYKDKHASQCSSISRKGSNVSCVTNIHEQRNMRTPLVPSQSSINTLHKNSISKFHVDFNKDPFVIEVRKSHGISKEYTDHGDPLKVCISCQALLWEDEMLRGNQDRKKKSFSLCCKNGDVQLPHATPPPPLLSNLYKGNNPRSTNFMNNIRAYNMMFAFTSMGGKIDKSLQNGKGPYVFRLQGQNFHRMGSLLPEDGTPPKFSQLYIYDAENEVENRSKAVSSGSLANTSRKDELDHDIIKSRKNMLDSCNSLVKSFRMVRECLRENDWQHVSIKLISNRATDGRTYNLPTSSEVAALIVGDIDELVENRDIVVRTTAGYLQRISELHPSYLALQYPLLFPYAEDGYRPGIKHKGVANDSEKPRTKFTMREFFCYRIQHRNNEMSLILHAKKLFHQFIVDAYTMVESERLSYIKTQQPKLRSDTFYNLNQTVLSGTNEANEVGKRILLPSSFTGGSRYMMQKYLDAMAICKSVGYPDLFITVTCNPNWQEIHRFLHPKNLKAEDCPDILTRVFKIKLDHLMNDLKKNQIFGPLQAVIYTVEFQKRGLPHAHICLFLTPTHKFPTASDVDRVISAEIPSKHQDPELYELVKQFMVHGPCGVDNPSYPCMVKNRCSKKFPKKFLNETSVDEDGYPIYRRRDQGNTIEKNGIQLDNRHVVPYNGMLLRKYQCHINVEWCNQSGSIKYLFKYINKGPDRVTASVYQSNAMPLSNQQKQTKDEVQSYLDCRYISACEAAWRIFQYDIHYRFPAVEVLPFHEKDKQCVVYNDDSDLCDIVSNPTVKQSMFIEWFERNKIDEFARTLKYVEFPRHYVWLRDKRKWSPRKYGGGNVGRIHYVPASLGEVYYLRMLLNHVKGPTCFDDIKTVNGHLFDTYKDACREMGLLTDDKEYHDAVVESSTWATASYVRRFFVLLLLSNGLTRPDELWNKTWRLLCEDIQHRQRIILNLPGLILEEQELKNLCLSDIEELLRANGSTLKNFPSMPFLEDEYVTSLNNRLIRQELLYDKVALQEEHAAGEIVLNVASSGIASLLLSGGRTAHSRFLIPINILENSTCSIEPNSDLSFLIRKAKLIIWDEAPMIHRHCFEAFDRTLKDILRSTNSNAQDTVFGGKVVVFGGDFRQILPVIPKGSRSNIVNATINSSYLWSSCQLLKLTVNMRLRVGCQDNELLEMREFADWILEVGDGILGESNDGEVDIQIPDDLLIHDTEDPVNALISFTYHDITNNLSDPSYLQQRAILAPTHTVVNMINEKLLEMIPGEEKVYLSSDTLCESDEGTEINNALFSTEVINSLQLSGLPDHKIALKVGTPIMLLRNIDQSNGLCNGTRLQVVKLGKHVIQAKVITGTNIGHHTLIPRLKMTPSDKRIPVKICRRQFPISVCFAMTINKSQGQSLDRVGLYLPRPVFSHGQLYVAVSRVKSRRGLKILICDKDNNVTNTTTNVVYKEVLQAL